MGMNVSILDGECINFCRFRLIFELGRMKDHPHAPAGIYHGITFKGEKTAT